MAMGKKQRETHEALVKARGDRAEAAVLLGVTHDAVRLRIQDCEELRVVWCEEIPKTSEVELLAGPAAVEEPKVESVEQNAQRRDEEFRTTLAHVGELPEDIVLAMGFHRLFAKNMRMCIDTIGGGVTMRAVRMVKMVDRLEQELKAQLDADPDAKKSETYIERLQSVGVLYTESTKALGGLMDRATNAMAAKAKIEMYQNQLSQGKNKGKPGFAPKTAIPA